MDIYPKVFGTEEPYKENAWWNVSYFIKKPMNVTIPSGSYTSNVSYVNVTWTAEMQPDFRDVVFINDAETFMLNFSMMRHINSSWAEYWFQMPVINTTTTAWLYCNGTGTYQGNLTNTLTIFVDNAEGGLGKWTITNDSTSNVSISTKHAIMDGGNSFRLNDSSASGINAYAVIPTQTKAIFGHLIYFEDGWGTPSATPYIYPFVLQSDSTLVLYETMKPNGTITVNGGGSGVFVNVYSKNDSWQWIEEKVNFSATAANCNASFWYEGILTKDAIACDTAKASVNRYYISSKTNAPVSEYYAGYIYVRDYNQYEPTVIVGTSQTLSQTSIYLNVTPNGPTNGTLTMNKTINFNYTLNITTPARVELHLNGSTIFTDDITTNTTITHSYNTVFGNHTWYIYAYNMSNMTINTTSPSLTFEVQFNVSNSNPPNAVSISTTSINFSYNVNTSYAVNCTLYLNTIAQGTDQITTTGTYYQSVGVSDGAYSWYYSCVGDTPSYIRTSTPWTFTNTIPNIPGNISINSSITGIVIYATQTIFYDNNGDLNTLFYIFNGTNPDSLYIFNISNNIIANIFTSQLNHTKPFYLVFRENGYNRILTFDVNGTTIHFLDYPNALTVTDIATSYNVTKNSYYDSYTYANTKQYPTINYVANSRFIFFLPVNNGTTILANKSAGSTSINTILTANNTHALAWQTIANKSDLTEWYFAWPQNTSTATDTVGVYYFNGAMKYLATPDNTDYSSAQINNSIVKFEQYNYTYFFISNITNGNATIQQIETGKTWSLNTTMTNPSTLFFIDKNTFVFFNNESGTTTTYSCYFGDATPSCSVLTSAQYGIATPYYIGQSTTSKRTGNSDIVAYGLMVGGSSVQLIYATQTYDAKFICWNETNGIDQRKQFTLQMLNSSNIIYLSQSVWGYVIPSSLGGSGQKQAWFTCTNGTNRLMIVGLNNSYQVDAYSLDMDRGVFCTFSTVNSFGSLIPSAIISAYRYDVAKGASVIIEQAITDSLGKAVLFLEPGIGYNVITTSGTLTNTIMLTPGLTCTVPITLTQLNPNVPIQNYQQWYNDIFVKVQPSNGYNTNISFDINLSITSANSTLNYFGWQITQNGTVVDTVNITGSPAGGNINYTATINGTYQMIYWFQSGSYTEVRSSTFIYYLNPTSQFQTAGQIINAGQFMSPFGFYIVALLLATIAGGYMARYSLEGGGLVALAVLWGFTFLYPDGVIVAPLTTWMVTTLTTIAAGAAFFVRSYV